MKKIFILLFLISATQISYSSSTVTLDFRLTNPRILYTFNNTSGTNCDNLLFDIEVKGSALSRYYALEIHMTSNSLAVADIDYLPGVLCDNGFYFRTTNLANDNINISSASTEPTNSGSTARFEQITTSYQNLMTIVLRITDITALQNSSWLPVLMDGQQYEKTFSPNDVQTYLGYNVVGTPVTNLYLGRIFSSGTPTSDHWSQVGGAVTDTYFVDWTTARNTSVWDSISAGGTATITGTNSQVSNLRIHTAAKLKILPGGELKVAGNTEINEPNGLWIASISGSSGAWMDNGEGSITYNGSATIRAQRYVGQDNWHGIAIPLHTTYARATFLNTYLKWYDEQRSVNEANVMAKWRYVIDPASNPDSALTGDLRGWMHWSTSTMTGDYTINYSASASNHLVSGSLSRSLTRTAFLSGTDPFDGWNFVGNMYPCPVDWKASSGWTKTNVDPTIYLWSQVNNNYATYNASNDANTFGGTRYIPAMQGYFVHVTAAGTLGMDNTVKVFNSQAFWKEQQSFNEQLTLNITGNGYGDETKVWFNSNANMNFDPNEDNYKLRGGDQAPQLYSISADGQDAAVNVLPWSGLNTVVPLGFFIADATVINASMSITASNMESFKPGTRIYLEDKKEIKMHELTIDPAYNFMASSTDDHNRFALHFYNPSFGIEDKNLTDLQIYSFEQYVYVRNLAKGNIKGTIKLYDLLGRNVFEANLNDIDLNKFLPGVKEGYYMVRVVTSDNSYTEKIYLK